MLQIQELEPEERYSKGYKEYREGMTTLNRTPTHIFEKEVEYKEAKLQTINLGEEDQPKEILIGDDWDPVLKMTTFRIFLEYKDVFAWTYRDVKGVPPEPYVHWISLVPRARPLWKQLYRMNKNYATKVEEEIKKMLEARIIFKVQTSEWVSPIVISLKDDNQIWICVDFRCLNEATIKDPSPIPCTNNILEEVVDHEIYSFMDGFSRYNQISIVEEDKLKTTFVVEDGVYAYKRMSFGLHNAPTTFQRIILHIFEGMSVGNFKAFLDDWSIYSGKEHHLRIIGECMDKF